jgi:hypothetical protein
VPFLYVGLSEALSIVEYGNLIRAPERISLISSATTRCCA